MATREEIADIACRVRPVRATSRRRSCWAWPASFEEAFFPEGERILRQGLTGSGFYVILDGDGRCLHRRHRQRATLHRGDFFGEVSILLGEPPIADVVAITPAALPRAARGPAVEPFLLGLPAGDVPDAPGAGPPAAERQPLAELAVDAPTRGPSRPASYPVVVIGSGPGALQVSLRRCAGTAFAHAVHLGRRRRRRHVPPVAVLPAAAVVDEAVRARPSAAPASTSGTTGTACSPMSPSCASLQTEFMDGTSYFPSRPEMQANLEAFAERAGDRRPLRLPLGARRGARTARTARRSCVETTDGEYRCRVLVLAVGVARAVEPVAARHRARPPLRGHARAPRRYAGKRLFIIGKQNSGFELASGLRPGPRRSLSARRRRPRQPSRRKSLVGVRARYVQPFEDAYLGLGVRILDASIDRPHAGGRRPSGSTMRRTDNGEADGASRPTRSSRRPASPARSRTSPISASRPSARPGCRPSRRCGRARRSRGSSSPGPSARHRQVCAGTASRRTPGAVHGHRYNSLILARHIARRRTSAPRWSGRRSRHRTSSPISSARRPARPSCGTRRRISLGS